MQKLILYELNEISPKILEYYINLKSNSALAKLINKNGYQKTFTTDEGELHPWSTWPTLHRGVNNSKHKIKFINQDLRLSNHYPPIWQILDKKNISLGIFGSLQSYPPLRTKNIKFFLPDTFAPDQLSYPSKIEDFQKFNLLLTRKNKAISRSLDSNSILLFIKLVKNNLISFSSAFKVISHLIKETIYTPYKTRRSLMQPILGFDLYFKLLRKENPQFSTFFSNHVAGIMHRYWGHLFPNESILSAKDTKLFYANSIIKALDIADKQIKQLIKFCNKNDYELLILSSMGQEAIIRDDYIPELFLDDIDNLISFLGLKKSNYTLLPAMQPDICIKCADLKSLESFLEKIKLISDLNGVELLRKVYEPVGNILNISLTRSKSLADSKILKYDNEIFPISDLGFSVITRHPGTGYHVPEGVFVSLKNKINLQTKSAIDTREICPLILRFFDLEVPSYMKV